MPYRPIFHQLLPSDFDSDDLEKKRTVVVKMGEKLTVLERSIQFIPNKYFVPLEEMNEKEKQSPETVRTGSKIPLKSTWLPLMDVLRNNEASSEDSIDLILEGVATFRASASFEF